MEQVEVVRDDNSTGTQRKIAYKPSGAGGPTYHYPINYGNVDSNPRNPRHLGTIGGGGKRVSDAHIQ